MHPVSLIITSFNREQYLVAAIESVLSQTYPHFSLLIWDDGSTDSSLSIAHQYATTDARIRVEAAPHQGLSKSLHDAVAATTHPYLGWVDSDDLLAPTALAETVAHLDAHPDTGLVYTNYQNIDANGNLLGLGDRCLIPYSPRKLLVSFMTFHFRLIRRNAYNQVGGINPTFQRAEDYDLCLRLSEITQIEHLKRPLYFYRKHSGNVTNNEIEMLRWTYQASQDALKRQGLAEQYEIKLNPTLVMRRKPETLPLVSIIITTYNSQGTLERCLNSCFRQTYSTLEIIVVDNNSTDGTLKLLQHTSGTAPLPFRYVHCTTQGVNNARNHGFLQARGDYIQWLDSDDELTPRKIARQVTELEKEQAVDIAYGDWQWCFYEQQKLTQKLTFPGKQYNDFLLQCLMDNWRPPHAYLLRRQAAAHLQSLPAWNPATTVCTDREYYTLAALEGYKFLYVSQSSVLYNGGLAPQITRSTPYAKRVENIQSMFQRFHNRTQEKATTKLGPTHRFLLTQSCELWQPAFSHIISFEKGFWLQHHKTAEKAQLRHTEVNIVHAWLKLPGAAFTLEDHARRIVRQLWQEAMAHIGKTQGLQATVDQTLINTEISKSAGLIPSSSEVIVPNNHSSQTVSVLNNSEMRQLKDLISSVIGRCPFYAPIFNEQRLRIHSVLEGLRQKGWLERTPISATEYEEPERRL